MKPSIEIKTVLDLPPGIEALRIEASSADFRFMEKLTKEWETQTNRFDKPGELLAGAFQNGQLVAIGGLNIDPYAGDITIARLRHLYMLKRIRRQGVASRLARYLLDKAKIGRHLTLVSDRSCRLVADSLWGSAAGPIPM